MGSSGKLNYFGLFVYGVIVTVLVACLPFRVSIAYAEENPLPAVAPAAAIIAGPALDPPAKEYAPDITKNATLMGVPVQPSQQQLSSTPSSLETDLPEYRRACFYVDESFCLNGHSNDPSTANASSDASTLSSFPSNGNSCHCRSHPTVPHAGYCCNITQLSHSACNINTNWTHLHIRNASLAELDLSNHIYQRLHSLAITDGNITRVIRSFARVSAIRCLNISNNNISEIKPRAFSNVSNLKFLDISKNNLTRIPNWNQNQNITVDVSGNKPLLCSPLLEAINHDSFTFVDPDSSFCLLNYTYNWFNSTDYVSISQLEILSRIQRECPAIPGYGKCTCSREQMIITGGDQPTAKLFCSVDCSGLGLTELPMKLPGNTFSLNISHNNISKLGDHFQNNPTYRSIVKLVADNNLIMSMNDLEGTKFMERFQRLYLRNNLLEKIPEYLLNNAFDSEVGRNIFLGGNKLICDCNSAKKLKMWLLERHRDIPDYNDIQCRNLPQRVMELQEIKLCQSPHDWTDYIYYLIGTEVFLLLALIMKVSYDYWVFKTAGYLPWPASKMPKLPCDWLCET